MIVLRTGYMDESHGDPVDLADSLRDATGRVRFDTLVGTGMSGALVVPGLARVLNVNWLILRKPGENSHSYHPGEGTLGSRWLFVDDLIDTGKTWRRVREQIADLCKQWNHKATFAGSFLYQECEYRKGLNS